MFRKVLPGREQEAMAFLSSEPEVNHFILGDVECYGLNDPNLSLWVEERHGLAAALLKYYGSFILYAPGGADYRHASKLMRETGFGMLSGKPEFIKPLLDELKLAPELQTNVLMKLAPGELTDNTGAIQAVKVDLSNLDRYLADLVALRQSITEFSMALNVDALRDELLMGCKRIYIGMEDNHAVSMAMTTVERRGAAMIVSVCTQREYRGRGHARALMSVLCGELAREGKTAVLFYNNPVAGRLYESLGFQDIGRWCFASF